MRAWLVVLMVLFATTAGAEPVSVGVEEDAEGDWVAVSVMGNATSGGVAYGGKSAAGGVVAVAGTGDASCQPWWAEQLPPPASLLVEEMGDCPTLRHGVELQPGRVCKEIYGDPLWLWWGSTCVAVNPTGDAECPEWSNCVAVSGTGDATCEGDFEPSSPWESCVALAGTGNASGAIAVSGAGSAAPCDQKQCTGSFYVDQDRAGQIATALSENQCGPSRCIAINASGDADGSLIAVSGTGDADANCGGVEWLRPARLVCIGASGSGNAAGGSAAAGLGDAESSCSNHGSPTGWSSVPGPRFGERERPEGGGCAAVSGTGEARGSGHACGWRYPAYAGYGWRECDDTTDVAVSGTGDASGRVAASGTGDARSCDTGYDACRGGIVGASGTGSCASHSHCVDVQVFDDAEGGAIGVSVFGNASGATAVSGTGHATSECVGGLPLYWTPPSNWAPCAAASGTGDAAGAGRSCHEHARWAYNEHGQWTRQEQWHECERGTDVAASGTGNATGTHAISGTGSARACESGYDHCHLDELQVSGRQSLDDQGLWAPTAGFLCDAFGLCL